MPPITSFATDNGTVIPGAQTFLHSGVEIEAITDEAPRGARPEDYNRRQIEETLEMLDDPGECAVADLFALAVSEEGAAWSAHEQSCAALHGVTATALIPSRLPSNWISAARAALAAEDMLA